MCAFEIPELNTLPRLFRLKVERKKRLLKEKLIELKGSGALIKSKEATKLRAEEKQLTKDSSKAMDIVKASLKAKEREQEDQLKGEENGLKKTGNGAAAGGEATKAAEFKKQKKTKELRKKKEGQDKGEDHTAVLMALKKR